MTATFTQEEINLREMADVVCELNAKVADNAKALLSLSAYAGRNILINGDKSVSQRGDFTVPFTATSDEVYVDRYKFITSSDAVGDYTHTEFDEEIQSGKIRIDSTSVSASGYLQLNQRIEYPERYNGLTVTYSAMVKSNTTNCVIGVFSPETGNVVSNQHSGSGQWELLTVTATITASAGSINFGANSFIGFDGINLTGLAIGEYMEVGQEQLELGSQFTGFELVDPATQLSKCKRYLTVSEVTGQASEFAHSMRALPTESGTGPYYYESEL